MPGVVVVLEVSDVRVETVREVPVAEVRVVVLVSAVSVTEEAEVSVCEMPVVLEVPVVDVSVMLDSVAVDESVPLVKVRLVFVSEVPVWVRVAKVVLMVPVVVVVVKQVNFAKNAMAQPLILTLFLKPVPSI
jgi:hypothetical protein